MTGTETAIIGSEPGRVVGDTSKQVGWYERTLTRIPDTSRRLLEEYSHIPPEDVIPHILKYRDLLWDVFPWPTIGQFRFISLSLYQQESYPDLVDTLKRGGRYLDIGCAVGQDLRRLVLDGCPSTNLFAIETAGGFVDLSYELFRDKDTLKADFIKADFLDRSNSDSQALLNTVDICHVGMVLHIFDLEGQTAACERLVEFMADRPGVRVVGSSAGRTEATVWNEGIGGKPNYMHNVESFEKMWEEVGRRTGTRWTVSAWMHDRLGLNEEKGHWSDPLRIRLIWQAQRV